MPFDNNGKNAMLDHLKTLTVRVSLHSADPGTTDDNEVDGGGYARGTPSWGSASGGALALASNLAFSTPASQTITWFALWNAAGDTRYGKGEITTGDTAANAAGEYELTTGTTLTITDD